MLVISLLMGQTTTFLEEIICSILSRSLGWCVRDKNHLRVDNITWGPDKWKALLDYIPSTERLCIRSYSFFGFAAREENSGRGFAPSYSIHVMPRLRRRKHGAPVQGKGRCGILGIKLERGAAGSLDKSDSRFTRRPNFDGTVQ